MNARNIGVIFDNHFHFNAHIASTCKSSFCHLRNISYIRKCLSSNSTEILVHAFVSSRLDHCNSLLYGLPNYQIKKLQHVQNAVALLITLSRKHEHITPILFNLHWLPINYHIMFKILLITYKAPNNLHLRTFAIYLYLTFHLVSYVHHLKIFCLFRMLIWEHTVQELSPWQPPHSGILCRLTLRIAPQCPFLKTDLKLHFLKKHFYNFFKITF